MCDRAPWLCQTHPHTKIANTKQCRKKGLSWFVVPPAGSSCGGTCWIRWLVRPCASEACWAFQKETSGAMKRTIPKTLTLVRNRLSLGYQEIYWLCCLLLLYDIPEERSGSRSRLRDVSRAESRSSTEAGINKVALFQRHRVRACLQHICLSCVTPAHTERQKEREKRSSKTIERRTRLCLSE